MKIIKLLGFIVFLLATSLWASPPIASDYVTRTLITEKSPESWNMKVSGNLDETRFLWPNMPAKKRFLSRISICNEGDRDVINPRVRINGFRMPLSSNELIQGISYGSEDPVDRVLRTYYAMCNYSLHSSAHAVDRGAPLSYFLSYGYGLCEDQTAVQAGLWQLYGYKWRSSWPFNHSSAEVEVQGRTIHLDTDLHAFYLLYDNRTIASAQDIHNDPMLVVRASHERRYDRFPRLPHEPEIDMYFSTEKYAALYHRARDSSLPPLIKNRSGREAFQILLRPGESYGWHTGERKAVHAADDALNLKEIARDVFWETHLDMANRAHLWFGKGWNSRRKIWNNGFIDLSETAIRIPYRLPFPLLGMRIRLIPGETENVSAPGPNEKVCIRIVAPQKTMVHCASLRDLTRGEFSLDRVVQDMPFPLREFRIEIDGSQLRKRQKNSLFRRIQVNLDCRSTIFAMRALRVGENTLEYSDDSLIRSVRVVAEAHAEHVELPRFSNGDFRPSASEIIPEANLQFTWPIAINGSVSGYHFQISAFPDMRYPLSPTFDRLVTGDQIKVSGGSVRVRLPWDGLLPVQKKLYWRVRPYNQDLLAGDWSNTASFEVQGPGAPEEITLKEQEGQIVLSWRAAAYGTRPVRYEIHTSNLEGFIPMDKPHRIMGLSDRNTNKRCWWDTCAAAWPVVPSTFFASTGENSYVLVPRERKNLKKGLGAHWRVIAIDAKGSRSCPSPQGFLRTPMLVSPEIVDLPAGKVSYRVPVISTLGRVYVKDDYDMGLWSKPQLSFALTKRLNLADGEFVKLSMLPADFTTRGYHEANPDLLPYYQSHPQTRSLYGSYENFLINHYGRHGIKEGRKYNVMTLPAIGGGAAWKIDETKGIISGTLKADEEASLHVSVRDQFGRRDSRVITFRVGGEKPFH
jgi:hypothetical protein